MAVASEAKARKHTRIGIKVKRIVRDCWPAWSVYLATYTARQVYQCIEQESGEEFWSIKAYSFPPQRHSRTKDPDALITDGDRVRFFVEIKWGAVSGSGETDMLCTQAEWLGMAQAFHDSAVCRIRGPAVEAGHRYGSSGFAVQRDYSVDQHTKLLVVIDLHRMKRLPEGHYDKVLRAWKHASRIDPSLLLADIDAPVSKIPSLRELLMG